MSTTLLLDPKKDTPVTLATLERMPDPVAMGGRHRPYRYDEIVQTLIESVNDRGYEIVKHEMALSRGDKMLLGAMQLRHEDAIEGRSIGDTGLRSDMALGYRGSYAQLSALKCVAGETVFMCSNLIMAAEMFIVARKFTTRMKIKDAISDGLDAFGVQHHQLEEKIKDLSESGIDDSYAKEFIFDSITKKGLPMTLARDVAQWYFGEEYGGPEKLPEDTEPRTQFGLHNAYTRSLRSYSAQARFDHTKSVGKLFGL